MANDDLLARMSQRLAGYQRSRRPEVLFAAAATAEAGELALVALPARAGESPAGDEGWRASACRLLGWWHFFRGAALPSDARQPELARAVLFLAEVAEDPAAVPDPMRAVLGPTANPTAQDNLGSELLRAAQRGTDRHLIDAGIILMRAAVAATADADPRLRYRLATLCIAYQWRYRRTDRGADLDSAIEIGERAVAISSADDPDFAGTRSNLAVGYRDRFERSGSLSDMARSTDLGREALAAVPADDPNRGGYLSNLGIGYLSRYRRTGDVGDLHEAIEFAEQAVACTPPGHPDHADYLTKLGAAYFRRYERTGQLADLQRAIESCERSLTDERMRTTVGDGHPRRVKPLTDLCVGYRERYQRTGDVADLHRAIESGERAYAALSEDDPRRATPASNLNLAYRHRYERTGDPADLQRAIDFGERSLDVRRDNTLNRASSLGNLSVALQRQYERTGVLEDLQRAIDLDEEALTLIPEGHPMRVNSLSNLCVAYRDRAGHTELLDDLGRAIEFGEQALAGTPADHPGRAISMGQLGKAYRSRYERRRDLADLDRTIELAQLALTAMPADHPNRYLYLTDLNIAYQRRFEHSGDVADARRGIRFQEEALAATPDEHPALALQVANLGQAYYTLALRSARLVRQKDLRSLVDRITAATTTTPGDQVRAYHVAGRLASVLDDHDLAVSLLDSAASLLPSIPPREAGWADQEQRLDRYVGLVRECIAAHCAIDDPAGAVQVAELSRGILLAAQLDSRTDLTDLRRTRPDLAAEFQRIREELATAETIAAADRIERRRKLWRQHDELLARIRRIDGHARFLLPPRLPELKAAAAGGAVILVNTTLRHGHAIIVTAAADPVLVPLPELGGAQLHANTQALIDVNQDTGLVAALRKQRVIPEILGWLWDVAVAPILAALPIAATPPRVWWMPTGLLSLFPWHATGHPGQPGALDAVVSSYTATLRTLAHARARPPADTRRQLTVALHHTPGAADLPGTATEAEHLHTAHPDLPALVDHDATTHAVLAALRDSTWAHFACHAKADLLTPSRSGLRLHDGTLTLPAIAQQRLANAELAYLSACSTANPGIQRADESLHLASAFQLAGFRHVIGTLWPISDDMAATTAREVYRHLAGAPAADDSAAALRQVTLDLRATHPTRPDLWAPLIHSGP